MYTDLIYQKMDRGISSDARIYASAHPESFQGLLEYLHEKGRQDV